MLREEFAFLKKREAELRISLFRRSPVNQRLKRLSTKDTQPQDISGVIRAIHQHPLTESEWADIISEINHYFDNFTVRLLSAFPTLTKGEIRLCCLMKIETDNTDISSFFQIDSRSVTRKKNRLKQKLKLKEKGQFLEDFLASF